MCVVCGCSTFFSHRVAVGWLALDTSVLAASSTVRVPAGGRARVSDRGRMDKRSLLDDVLTRFVPEKADQNLIRDRTLGYNKREFPVQKIGELKQIPERPRFSARMGQLLGGGDGDVVSPSPSPKKPPPRDKPRCMCQ